MEKRMRTVMPQTPDLSPAKRALLARYLGGEAARTAPTACSGAPVGQRSTSQRADVTSRVPVVTLRAAGSQPPLFYLHPHWEGGALYAFHLSRVLGEQQPFYLLDPYQFEDLDALPSFETMAAGYREVLQAVQPVGPYRLCGFCGGALVAYEVAQQLQAQGYQVEALVMVDPQAGPGRLMLLFPRLMRRCTALISRLVKLPSGRQLNIFVYARHLIRLRYAHYRHSPGITLFPAVGVLRRDWLGPFTWVASGYVPQPYNGTVTYLLPKEQTRYDRMPWATLADASTTKIRHIPGNSWTCRGEYAQQLGEALQSCLADAYGGEQ
jgi:hypothetical protein